LEKPTRKRANPGVQATGYTRREQFYLAGMSPFALWRAWPVTGGG